MRIAFVLPYASLAGGVRVVATYARLLQERGHEVTVVSQPYREVLGRRKRILKSLGLYRPVPPTPTPLLDVLGNRHRILDQPGPVRNEDLPDADVIVATWWETAEWVAALSPPKGRKFYLLQGYEVFPYLPVDRVIATYHLPLRKIAVSSYIRNEISTHHGVTDIEIVANGVDIRQFSVPPRGRAARPTVGFIHSPLGIKNTALAIEAIRLAKARLPDLRAQVFGAGQPSGALSLPDWASWHCSPPQADIPGIYATCDAWLFTSEKEGFGLPILEAMACRTPVLATRAGAAPDLVNGRNGLCLAPDPESFAQAIQRIATLPDPEWRAMSDAARETAESHDWNRSTDRLLACFARG